MICPKCRGVGRIPFGEEPEIFSEEEWLRQATTEQLAEWIAERIDTPCDICNYNCRSKCMANAKQVWLEWLKQPHTFK